LQAKSHSTPAIQIATLRVKPGKSKTSNGFSVSPIKFCKAIDRTDPLEMVHFSKPMDFEAALNFGMHSNEGTE